MSAVNTSRLGEIKTMGKVMNFLGSVLFLLLFLLRKGGGGSIKLSPAGSVKVSTPDTPQHFATVGN